MTLHALAREPDGRPPSAAELRSELLASLEDRAAPPVPTDDSTFVESSAPADGTSVTPAPSPIPPPPTVPPPGAARPAAAPAPTPRPSRNWTGPALLIVLVMVALGVAGVLLGQVFGDQLFGEDDEPRVPGVEDAGGGDQPALTLTATAFDPDGDGSEHDGEAPLAVDGDVGTAWTSEEYASREDFQGLKPGVGLILTLAEAAELGTLGVEAGNTGWAAQVYVADAPSDSLDGWGEPVAEGGDLGGRAEFDLSGRSGAAVLLWITDLGTGAPQAVVSEVGLSPGGVDRWVWTPTSGAGPRWSRSTCGGGGSGTRPCSTRWAASPASGSCPTAWSTPPTPTGPCP